MAIGKSITVTQQYQNNATSPTTVSFPAEPIVSDSALIPPYQATNPGVFTAGTAREGSSSNPNNDGNQ